MASLNLQQQIYDESSGTTRRYLFLSRRREQWEVVLWRAPGNVWAGVGDDTRAAEIANAVVAGMMSVQDRANGGIKLLIHTPKTPVSVYLDPAEPGQYVADLLDGAFSLVSRPTAKEDNSEVRSLNAQLARKDDEITSLNARLMNLKATVQRQPGIKDAGNAVKKPPPVTMGRLQPNQKRRKLVEDEFAGSSDEDDSDEDDDEDEDEDEE